MIYFLYGNDFTKARSKLREILSSQIKKNPDSAYFKLNDDNWDEEKLEELIVSQGLFQNKYIVVLDGLLQDEVSREAVLKRLKEMENSENLFIITEGEIKKEIISKIEKRAEKVQKFENPKKISTDKNKKDFNIFALADALGMRDKKRLWVLYQRAILSGLSPEEIHPILLWQVKAMILGSENKDANEAGLNPFVFRKSLGFAKNFKKEELVGLSRKLVFLYHDARLGKTDFDIALERFVLEV